MPISAVSTKLFSAVLNTSKFPSFFIKRAAAEANEGIICQDHRPPYIFMANLEKAISFMSGEHLSDSTITNKRNSCTASIPLNTESLRKTYLNKEEPFLLESNMLTSPFEQFDAWFKNIVAQTDLKYEEVNAFALSTVNSEGKPSSRMLLLKGYSREGGFVFFTHSNSRKSLDLATNPNASGLFYWPKVDRQVRVEGLVKILDKEVAENYWYKRPIASRIGSKLSNQSSVIPGREYLTQKQNELEELCATEGEQAITRPNNWLGYALHPNYFEFWQGQPNRVHDRIVYTQNDKQESDWVMKRLAP